MGIILVPLLTTHYDTTGCFSNNVTLDDIFFLGAASSQRQGGEFKFARHHGVVEGTAYFAAI